MRGIRGLSVADRFWSKVKKSDGCWEWQAGLNLRGYGQFAVTSRKGTSAHRYSYRLAFGSIPEGLWVLHHCDNPKCVRPDHLFAGTPTDNVRDMWAKGRQSPPPPGGGRAGMRATHCKRGHPFSGENLTFSAGGKKQACMACRKINWKRWAAERKNRQAEPQRRRA